MKENDRRGNVSHHNGNRGVTELLLLLLFFECVVEKTWNNKIQLVTNDLLEKALSSMTWS